MSTTHATYRRWLNDQFKWLDGLVDLDGPDYEDVDAMIRNAANRAAKLGLAEVVKYARMPPGGLAPGKAREILADCLTAVDRRSPVQESWIDADGAAKYLGVTLNSLYGLVERRKLVPDGRGPKRRYRFKTATLDAYVRNGK